jgi:hypothetical protein
MERVFRLLKGDGRNGGVRKCSDLGVMLYGMAYLSCEYWRWII